MADTTSYIPANHHTVTPYMVIKGAAEAIEFYKQALGARETYRQTADDGRIRHAEIMIGNSPIMLVDEWPESNQWLGPQARGGTPVHMYLYVEDADAIFNSAIAAGATELFPMQDQAYGDRSGGIVDPYGHVWYIATHLGTAAE